MVPLLQSNLILSIQAYILPYSFFFQFLSFSGCPGVGFLDDAGQTGEGGFLLDVLDGWP